MLELKFGCDYPGAVMYQDRFFAKPVVYCNQIFEKVILLLLSKTLHWIKMGIVEKINDIENEIKRTQKNKG